MAISKQASELESALLQRAQQLADEYLERGRRGRDHILEEANERLRLREEREMLVAKEAADRAYRQQVQAAQIRLQTVLDQERWGLVQSIFERIPSRLQEIGASDQAYLPLLRRLIDQAAESIGADPLMAVFNERDRKRLVGEWETFIAGAGTQIILADETITCSSGVLVRTTDNRIHVDNTFEGRHERFQSALYEVVIERMFPQASDLGSGFHG